MSFYNRRCVRVGTLRQARTGSEAFSPFNLSFHNPGLLYGAFGLRVATVADKFHHAFSTSMASLKV